MSKRRSPTDVASTPDRWASGEAYHRYIGRWSEPVAGAFVQWLNRSPALDWLDVGCGAGAVTRAVCALASPTAVAGLDPSAGLIQFAQRRTAHPSVRFTVGSAEQLPFGRNSFDVVVSGLVLNFLGDAAAAVGEMIRVSRPGGLVAGYVWDYTGEMQMLRYFWTAVLELVPDARNLDEVRRFALCQPDALGRLFRQAGLADVTGSVLDLPTHFRDFDDLWEPFLAGQGAAPAFVVSLPGPTRVALRESLRERLPLQPDGSIALLGRALAVQGRVPPWPALSISGTGLDAAGGSSRGLRWGGVRIGRAALPPPAGGPHLAAAWAPAH